MATGPEHYREGEHLIETVTDGNAGDTMLTVTELVSMAQAHFTAALVAAQVDAAAIMATAADVQTGALFAPWEEVMATDVRDSGEAGQQLDRVRHAFGVVATERNKGIGQPELQSVDELLDAVESLLTAEKV